MPTHANIAAQLLRDAATLFRNMGESNIAIKAQMETNAATFEQMAILLEQNPLATSAGKAYSQLAEGLLKDTAVFFRSLAESNEPIREQMVRSAEIYEHMAKMVAQDPLGVMD